MTFATHSGGSLTTWSQEGQGSPTSAVSLMDTFWTLVVAAEASQGSARGKWFAKLAIDCFSALWKLHQWQRCVGSVDPVLAQFMKDVEEKDQ